ncbi:MAG: preprotein translocase subunit SecG [Desulfobulbaceae bacterium]|nr:preprotein translocase subunit SecG [Desulfobulbaceae bacterium]
MPAIISAIHVIVCLFLIVIVLLQHGKGADIGATFGGGNTVFGSEGPVPLLNKVTTGAAVIFMITSIGLAYLSAKTGTGSVMQNVAISKPVLVEKPLETGPVKVPMSSSQTPGSSEQAPAQFPGQAAPTK